ncbi:MAG: PAS domain S-box protein [Proteobacteria bacterium]|nr:PAS domain S-box protein [Pseudomonadota bacterium]
MVNLKDFLKTYDHDDFIIQLKATFIFYICIAILICLPIIILYSTYIEYQNQTLGYSFNVIILLVELISALFVAGALYFLARGYYCLASHFILIVTLATVWAVMFLDTATIVSRLDTIAFVFCTLSITPLVISKRTSGIVFYFFINVIILLIFVYYLNTQLHLERTDMIDYLSDNLAALFFICFTSYNIFTINRKALQKTEEDVRERKIAEKALKESEERYRLIAENVSDVIWTSDMNLQFTYVSPSIIHLLGYTPEESMKKSIYGILTSKSLEKSLSVFERVVKFADPNEETDQRSVALKLELLHKDGHTLWTESKVTFFHDSDRKITGLLGVTMDISEQHRAMEEKKKLEAQLIQSQKMEAIGTLAGGIAHDFNNILAAIFGFAQLSEINLPKNINKAIDYIAQIQKASMRAKDLVQLILAFSRQNKPEMRPIELDRIIEDALKLLRASIPTTIKIEKDIKEELCIIMANQTQIHQVIMNLCTNASHAMEENGGVLAITLNSAIIDQVESESIPGLEPGLYLKMSVQDTGQGMDPETLERIFDPYFTTKKPGEGTGLGLAVAHGIMKSHGGAISVFSEPGAGSIFHVYFPCADKNEQIMPIDKMDIIDKGQGRILFVDDEAFIVELGKEMLNFLGYEVKCTTLPEEALRFFEESPDDFDAVITDMTMPILSGDKLAKKLMAIRPDIPIIVSTGFSKRLTPEQAGEMGIKAYLFKPLSMADLSNALKKALHKNLDR